MNNRIGLLLKVKDVTASRFAEMIGVQPSNISHILSGRNKPSLDFIIKVTETFPDISLEWLMFGRGSMFSGNIDEASQKGNKADQWTNHNENAVDSGAPDLFSQIQSAENLKIDIQPVQDDDDHEKNEFNNSLQDIISETHEVENEVVEKEEKEEFLHRKSETDSHVQEITINKDEVTSKPVKIIMVYPDDTFIILQERRNTKN
jgi:transcriptional regulator with XRE-family HTH domain